LPLRIKICGITNVVDAVAAVDAGADALGFMFFDKSKRHVTAGAVAEIVRELPPLVAKVGVFVNPTADFVHETIEVARIDTIQLHGEETPEFCAQFPLKVIKAFRVKDHETLRDCLHYREHAWLLDSYVEGALGGTGVTFNWDVAVEATRLSRMVMLAGGLKVETVAGAVAKVRPYAVDVSSGVEAAPGKKNPAKIRAFIQAAREAAE
jgi:phosphoribosylanthranilate isomerase